MSRSRKTVTGGSTIAWTYDANGNTATKTTGGVTHTYSYDRENRLVDVSTTSGSIFSAVYDYRSRRLEKTENSSTVKYLYDGGVSVQEYDSQGSLTKVLVRGSGYGGGIGSVIYTANDANGTNRRFFLYNALGSTSAMTNDSMTVTSTSSYDGWGKEVASTGSSETDRKFCTKERSASIGLDYFGFRYYDYDLGRFTTRDPSGYPDGLNNYLYCSNDPVNKIDPLGLRKMTKKEQKIWSQAENKVINDGKKDINQGKEYFKARYKALGELKTEVKKIKTEGKEGYDAKESKLAEVRVSVAFNVLNKWANADKYEKYKYENEASSVEGGPSRSPQKSWKCNRFVADAYGEVVNYDVSKKPRGKANLDGNKGYPLQEDKHGNKWPARANSLGQDHENIRSFSSTINKGADGLKQAKYKGTQYDIRSGDIVAFQSPGGVGHTGIALGKTMMIEASSSSSTGINFRPISDASIGRDAKVRTYTGSGK